MHPLDRPLLIGLVALEQELVSAAELIDAFRAWRREPGGSLAKILASRGKLSLERMKSLEDYIAGSSLMAPQTPGNRSDGPATTTWRRESTAVVENTPPTKPFHAAQADPKIEVTLAEQRTAAVRFKPIHLHAQGGLGHVFLAEDTDFQRHVALKEIRFDAADEPETRERFIAEAKITGNLEHPGIVPVYGLGVNAEGRPFYAMRFIQGENFSAAIKKFYRSQTRSFQSIEFRQLLTRLVSVCNAVAFAHSRGIVHRDLKPQNIMLGPFGETLVVDWGLAKPMKVSSEETTIRWLPQWPTTKMPPGRESVTAAGEIVGTPAFMSPEQAEARGDAAGAPSDIYSLGATLYVLLTGQTPLSGNTSDILEATKQEKIVPPRQIQPRAPRALAAICQKAMAHQPQQRYLSALDLAADLERWLADEPVLAYREPWSDKAFRWVKRHRVAVAIAIVALLLASVGLGVGYTLVRKERDTAQAARKTAEHERASAVTANELARKNAATTLKLIEEYLIRIGDDRFSAIPGFEGVRLELANMAVDRYRDVLAQQPEDASLVANAGMAARRTANLYRMMGQDNSAENFYNESIKYLKNATQQPQQAPRAEQWLCETLCDQALLTSRVRGPEAAIEPMRQALAASRQLQLKNPSSIAMRQITARIEGDLADLLRELGKYQEAIALARSASATQGLAADQNSRPLSNRLSATFSAVNLGEVLHEADQAAEAEIVLNKALDRVRGYLKESPSEPNLRYIAARALHELALVHANDSEAATATAEMAAAAESLNRLAVDFPMVISYRRKLAQVLTDRARQDLKRGEAQSAADAARRSIELLEEIDLQQKTGAMQRYLTSAYLVAAEAAQKRDDAAAARDYATRARASMERAQAYNADSPKLAEEAKRLQAFASALAP